MAELETRLQAAPLLDYLRPRTTGALFVSLSDDSQFGPTIDKVRGIAGSSVQVVHSDLSTMSSGQPSQAVSEEGGILIIDELLTAIVDPPRQEGMTVGMARSLRQLDTVEEVRPELYFFSLQDFRDTSEATWGLGATHALVSPYTGKGIKVAILDTGIDLAHPDFRDRTVTARSFIGDETIEDRQGHGTHCAGTAVGRAAAPGTPRYGVAPDADLYVGKVLNNAGFGAERQIIAGIMWAIGEKCDVISMSLGSPVQVGQQYSKTYERAGQLALQNGCLILAAAGNDSNRTFGVIAPVSSPANAPSIIAVGAIDPLYAPCYFSNGGINGDGGAVDLVAPGSSVFSTVPLPQLYKILDGTSMACPHAAGIAALWAESDPALRGMALWDALIQNARSLNYNVRDVGAGIATAPKGIETS